MNEPELYSPPARDLLVGPGCEMHQIRFGRDRQTLDDYIHGRIMPAVIAGFLIGAATVLVIVSVTALGVKGYF
jgi:hypothetical protein